jgi:hypothetical protein
MDCHALLPIETQGDLGIDSNFIAKLSQMQFLITQFFMLFILKFYVINIDSIFLSARDSL